MIEASQWFKDGDHRMVNRYSDPVARSGRCSSCNAPLVCHGLLDTLEGEMRVCPGDWIIRGIHNELYPCKPQVFNMTYEPVEEVPPGPMDLSLKEELVDG